MYVRNSRKMAKLKNTVNLSKIIFFIIIILHAHPQYVCKTLAIEWDVQHYYTPSSDNRYTLNSE